MDDKDLRQSVIEELDFTPSFDAADIGVAVENGVVTLTGHVRSYAEKLAVERAAQRVRGVHGIAEEMRFGIRRTRRLPMTRSPSAQSRA